MKKSYESKKYPIKIDREICQGKPKRDSHAYFNLKWVLYAITLLLIILLIIIEN